MKSYLKLAIDFVVKNGRNRELKLLAFTIFISVVSITSIVSLLQDIQTGLEKKTGSLVGSDRAIVSPIPLEVTLVEEAKKLNLTTTTTLSFLSMLVHDQELALARVRAIGKGYPLRGELRTALELFGRDQVTSGIPEQGTVWLEPRLFSLLGAKLGDSIGIGAAVFKIARVLTVDPDKTIEISDLESWALINEQDVPATEIIQPGSRVDYKLLMIGDPQGLAQMETWVKPRLTPAQRWIDIRHSRPLINQVVERVNHYLGLIFLMNISLAGIAIWMVMKQFCQRQFDTVAILRCLGASHRWMAGYYGLGLMLLALTLGLLGIVCGYAIKTLLIGYFFKNILANSLQIQLGMPIAVGLLTVFILLFGFAFPPLFSLRNITPLRVIRRDLPPISFSHSIGIGIALLAIAVLILLQTQNIQVMGPLILVILWTSVALWGLVYIILKSLSKLKRFLAAPLQFNIRNLQQRAAINAIPVFAFSLVLGLLGTLYLVRSELIRTWQDEVAISAPNYFVLNIPPSQLTPFQELLKTQEITSQTPYPMMVGRLLAVNQELVSMNEDNPSTKRIFKRLLNLTWSSVLPEDNKIIEGRWFNENDRAPSLSIEQGFAERLAIRLGDTLKLQISEKVFELPVTSIRKVNWNSFQPNFFVIFSPGVINNLPATYMTSFYLSEAQTGFLKQLVQHFPMISIIDIQMILTQVRMFVMVISIAIEYLWIFTLSLSLILLFATIRSTIDERKSQAVLLRILGVSHQRLWSILLSEFLLLGLLAGILGLLIANLLLYWLSVKVFSLTYQIDFMLIILLPILGMVLVGFGGWFGTRSIFSMPPLRSLPNT